MTSGERPTRVEVDSATFPVGEDAVAATRTWLADVVELSRTKGTDVALVASELVSEALEAGAFGSLDVAVAWVPSGLEVSVRAPADRVRRAFTVQWRRHILERLAADWVFELDAASLSARAIVPIGEHGMQAMDADLFCRAKVDPYARDAVYRRFLPLARQIAGRYRGSGIDIDDLEQVAGLALMGALDRFDPEVGDFEHYAAATVSGELKRYLRDHGWAVRVPRSLQESVLEVSRVTGALTQRLGRAPTPSEIGRETGMAEEEVRAAWTAGGAYRSTSLSALAAGSDSETTILDRMGGEDPSLRLVEDWASVADALAMLPEREQRILALRFGHDLTQSEIASVIGVSQMHVSRLLAGALARLRTLVEGERDTSPAEQDGDRV